ncbi:MAG: helix-turn-helix domain-containing protein, partial [Alistipes sp.]|nr:helix-turn-helix domain-containing protein [Alistipes sp.]
LCISTRYLSTVVRSIAHSSVKEFVDRAVVLEIKMLLQSSDLSVQEIAYRLHFPDQSYLGRYFKNHTGMSPTEYRNARK